MVKTIIKLSHNNFILATVEIVYPTSESKFAAYEAGFSEPTLNFRSNDYDSRISITFAISSCSFPILESWIAFTGVRSVSVDAFV